MRLGLLVLALLATAGLFPGDSPAADEDEEVAGPLPWEAGPETFLLRRILDGATGRPVPGARVDLHVEVPHPVPGLRKPVASGTSDAAGWVRIERSALDPKVVATYGEPGWAFAEAPGLGPDEDHHSMVLEDPDWELQRAAPLSFLLVDPLDRPVAGAQVSWLLGCGHTPDVRLTTTDANGLATFPDVASESGGRGWVVAPGLRCRYLDASDGFTPWRPRRTFRLAWGLDVEGTLLRADGSPAAGAAIGAWSAHRGPWTLAGADGSFRLVGTDRDPGHGVTVEDGEYPVGPARGEPVPTYSIDAPPAGVRVSRTLRSEEDAFEATTPVTVHLERPDWPTRDVSGGTVIAVRLADGWVERGGSAEDAVPLDLRPGVHEVHVTSRGDGLAHSRASARVTVVQGVPASVRVALPAPAMLVLRVPEDLRIRLETERESAPLDVVAPEVTTLVPVDRPIFVRLDGEDSSSELVAVPREHVVAGVRSTPWALPIAKRGDVRARLVDLTGRPVLGRLADDDEAEPPKDGEASAEPRLGTRAGPRRRFVAWPDDLGSWTPRFVERPAAGADPADLGVVTMSPRGPRLVVVLPEATSDVQVRLTRERRTQVLHVDGEDREAVLHDPWDAPGLLGPGTIARVLRDDGPPIVRTLEGPGPWRMEVPTGTLTVTPKGDVEDYFLTVDGHRLGLRDSVPWLADGPHEAVIEAKGHAPRRLRFTLAPGATHVWTPTLRPR